MSPTTDQIEALGRILGLFEYALNCVKEKLTESEIADFISNPHNGMALILLRAYKKQAITSEISDRMMVLMQVLPAEEICNPLSLQDQGILLMSYTQETRQMELPVGLRIKQARQKQNMTQGELAEKSGVGKYNQHISRWESGEVCPNRTSIEILRRVLGWQNI